MSHQDIPHDRDEPDHLLEQLMENNAAAWCKFREHVYKIFYRLLSGSPYVREPRVEADDLTQNLMLKFYEMLNLAKSRQIAVQSPLPYAYGSAKNRFLNHLRHIHVREQKTPHPETPAADVEIIDGQQFLDDVMNDWIRRKHRRSEKRLIITLLRGGNEIKEIAKLLSINESRVYATRTKFINHAKKFAIGEGLT